MGFAHVFIACLFALMVGHALADYPLQGDFIAQAKSPKTALGQIYWKWVLPLHALIHGGFVWLVTGLIALLITGSPLWLFGTGLLLGLAETLVHGSVDQLKNYNKISFNTDQTLHVACKVLWAGIVALQLHQ